MQSLAADVTSTSTSERTTSQQSDLVVTDNVVLSSVVVGPSIADTSTDAISPSRTSESASTMNNIECRASEDQALSRKSSKTNGISQNSDLEAQIFVYSDSVLYETINMISTIFSSCIPITAILALYFVEDMGARLGAICGFTVLFSVCLTLVTEARRVEIFAATAA